MDFSKVKLKKTQVNEKGMDLKEEMERENYQNERLRSVDLESWYDKIEDFTFPTELIDLSTEEAKELIAAYWVLKKNENRETWRKNEILLNLASKIEKVMKIKSWDHVFAKLSSRSPKDSRACQAKAKEIALERLKKLQKERELSTNDLVIAIMTTGIETLRMESAHQIIDTFLTSDRVCEDDLPLALNFPKKWSQHIVIRKWISIPIQYEFRAFVIDNKITGLTQYFNNAYFPDLVENKDKILKLVLDLFEKVKTPLDMKPPDYVLDIAVDLINKKAYVIELNPFGRPTGMGTGTSLFNIDKQEDLKILFGESPFEFRIETQAATINPEKFIRGSWKIFFQENHLI